MTTPRVLLDLPFRGRWQARNGPARRVPSHGTHLFGVTYAIDFVAVDERGRSAPRSWRSFLSAEPPEKFRGFGQPILAPVSGTVVVVHDGEPDHVARRSQITRVPYALSQIGRIREGITAIAGNHVAIAIGPDGPFVAMAHLRRGSVRVRVGQRVTPGNRLGECDNSGNSTEPHVHVQVTDSIDWPNAEGIPMAFHRGEGSKGDRRAPFIPGESDIVIG